MTQPEKAMNPWIKRVEKLLAEATKGPWHLEQGEDAALIAAARTLLPQAVERERALRRVIEALWTASGDALKLAEGTGIRQAPDENTDWFCSWCKASSPMRADLVHKATCKWTSTCTKIRNAQDALAELEERMR